MLLLPLSGLLAAPIVATTTGAWKTVGGSLCAAGLIGLGLVAWRQAPLAQQLNDHKHEMLRGFRENEPI